MIINFFETIDTEAKAYFLGFIFADGWICRKHYTFQLGLHVQDLHIVQKLKECLESPNRLYFTKKNAVRLQVCNKVFCDYLFKQGCIPNKTFTLKFPEKVPDHLMCHFIRGLYDGDGCVSKGKRGRQKTDQFVWFICGTKDICENVNKIFTEKLGFPPDKTKDRKNIFRYTLNGNKMCRKIYHYLYDEASSGLYLIRKKQFFENIFTIIPYHSHNVNRKRDSKGRLLPN